MVGKFNTRNCKGSVKDLLGFPPKQKLLFLFGRMYSSMFPCQVECWSGIMHSLGMTDHVLRLGGAGLLGCACGVSLLCGSLKRKQIDFFSSPPSVKPQLRRSHFSPGNLCLTAQHKPTSVLHLMWALSPKLVILPKCHMYCWQQSREAVINQTSQCYIWERGAFWRKHKSENDIIERTPADPNDCVSRSVSILKYQLIYIRF